MPAPVLILAVLDILAFGALRVHVLTRVDNYRFPRDGRVALREREVPYSPAVRGVLTRSFRSDYPRLSRIYAALQLLA